jgi:hypothetical protein
LFVREVRRNSRSFQSFISRDDVLIWVNRLPGVTAPNPGELTNASEPPEAWALAAWVVTRSGVASLSQTAKWFECAPSTVYRATNRYSKCRPDLFNEQTLAQFYGFLQSFDPSEAQGDPCAGDERDEQASVSGVR